MHSAHPKWWLWKFWWQIWWLCNSAYNIRNISFEFVAFDVLYRQAKLFFIAWAIKWAFLQKLALVEFQFRLNQVHHKHKLHLMEYHLRLHRPSFNKLNGFSISCLACPILSADVYFIQFFSFFVHSFDKVYFQQQKQQKNKANANLPASTEVYWKNKRKKKSKNKLQLWRGCFSMFVESLETRWIRVI